jgi:hypothetical protein
MKNKLLIVNGVFREFIGKACRVRQNDLKKPILRGVSELALHAMVTFDRINSRPLSVLFKRAVPVFI